MPTRFFISLIVLLSVTKANATWSLIVIDPATHAIGIAAASCSRSVYGIQSVVPGKGAVIVQAASNADPRRKGVDMIFADAAPEDILRAMRNPNFDPENQQYAVITVKHMDHPVTYTGTNATTQKGAITGNGISVQGNTLVTVIELTAVYAAVLDAQKRKLPLTEILMLGLEAGAKLGGDRRCGERTASSSFISIFQPGDDITKPGFELVVNRENDTLNAVVALRAKLEAWKKKSP